MIPSATSIAILVNPRRPDADIQAGQLQRAAQSLGLQFHVLTASSERDFDAAFQTMVQLGVSAIVVAPDASFSDRRDQIVALAAPLIEAASRSSGVDVFVHSVHSATEIESVITAFAAAPNGGVIAIPSALMFTQRNLIFSLANRSRLPSVSAFRYFAVAGGLVSYGIDNIDLYRRAAAYVDRIFNGEKPSDLPVKEATKFQLVINLKTAKALGLTAPSALLATADELIE